jgi:hypothetical protein
MGVGVTLYVGECYEHQGENLRAWRQFVKAEELASAKSDRRQRIAHERAERLWSTLAKIRIVVPAVSRVPGLVVTDDGEQVPLAGGSAERPVEPRVHRIRAVAPDREPWELAIDVPAGGQPVAVEVPPLRAATAPPRSSAAEAAHPAPTPAAALAAAPPSPVAPPAPTPVAPPAPTGFPARKVAALALLGAGALGIGLSAAFGLDAKSKLDGSNAGPCQPNDHCDAAGLAERSDALTSATISTVAFVGGAAFAVGGVALLLISPKREPVVSVLAHAEGTGATLTVQRRW